MITVNNVSFNYKTKQALNNINLVVNKSEIIGLVGASGSGKSTLLKTISGTAQGHTGEINFNSIPLSAMRQKSIHATISYYNNNMPVNMDEYVYDFVLLARLRFKHMFRPFSEYDLQATEEQIKRFNLAEVRDLPLTQLPHSLFKRTLLAHILNRDAQVLVLDNPDCELDIKSMSLFRKALIRYVLDGERTIIMASNNINFISQTADRIILMDQGTIAMDGHVSIINSDILKKYFNVDVIISHNIYNGKPEVHIFPEN